MRSKLFVPGARPELFDKALAGEADAVSFDLEDSVPADGKAAARSAVADCLARAAGSAKTLVVRVNALASTHFAEDVAAVATRGIALLNLPMVESADDVHAAVEAIARAEAANGVTEPIALLLNIETPAGLARAAEIAAADRRVAGLQLGLGDLFEPHGIDRHDAANVHAVMFAVRMAAARAGVYAVDGAFARVDDPDGFTAEAARARRLGFVGKSCIHPRQVALANTAFAPTTQELERARRIVAAADAAGRGAFLVDGAMVDAPFLARARALLASAQ